ncbi:MAG: hypothetical protein GXX95_06710 [Methanomassiliicoccus sp.]|mgnify:CR=1 FL=1|jgi:hypothetical protein|nr:hypothetical protein [Methanomassiliicoccus sp.]
MAREKDEDWEEEGADEEDDEEEMEEEGLEPVMSENAVIDVAFGEPEDGWDEEERVLDWVSSFKPGEFQRQVADLFLSDGEVYIMMDKMTVVLPMMELFRLLESAGAISDNEEI